MLEESVVTAGELMTRDVVTVARGSSMIEAVRLMARHRISGLPVVDAAGGMAGMLTEGDLLRWHEGQSEKQARWLDKLAEGGNLAPDFLEGIRNQQLKVEAVMSPGMTTIGEDTPAREIASLMVRERIKRAPVLHDGRLVGIVTRSDLVRALAGKLGEARPSRRSEVPASNVDEALRRRRDESVTR
ncbi:MAG: CBS domain-containing protein [Acetobacteraceae bacterium]